MEETPVSVLCKRINFYHSFIHKLKTKEGIDKKTPQKKLDKLISSYEQKILEFETAIKILDPNAKCDKIITESDNNDVIMEIVRNTIPALIVSKSSIYQ